MKELLKILISFILSFGFWYLIGAFLANSWDIMEWSIVGKIFYLIFSLSAWSAFLDEI